MVCNEAPLRFGQNLMSGRLKLPTLRFCIAFCELADTVPISFSWNRFYQLKVETEIIKGLVKCRNRFWLVSMDIVKK